MIFYHVRYLSHFVLQVGSSNWAHKARIHSSQIWCHFGAKLADPLSSWKIGSTHFLSWIKYSWSGLTHIVSFINLSGIWIKLCRNQISSCQHVFYYTFINYGLKSFITWYLVQLILTFLRFSCFLLTSVGSGRATKAHTIYLAINTS
jgi:hypothetical protein